MPSDWFIRAQVSGLLQSNPNALSDDFIGSVMAAALRESESSRSLAAACWEELERRGGYGK